MILARTGRRHGSQFFAMMVSSRADQEVISLLQQVAYLGKACLPTNAQSSQVVRHLRFSLTGLRSRSSKAEHIAAGTFGSFVITTSGHTIAFGVNASGQLGFTATVIPELPTFLSTDPPIAT